MVLLCVYMYMIIYMCVCLSLFLFLSLSLSLPLSLPFSLSTWPSAILKIFPGKCQRGHRKLSNKRLRKKAGNKHKRQVSAGQVAYARGD